MTIVTPLRNIPLAPALDLRIVRAKDSPCRAGLPKFSRRCWRFVGYGFSTAMLLADLFRQQYVPLRLLGRSPRTVAYYLESLAAYSRFLQHPARLGDLTDANLAAFGQSYLDKQRSPATANANLRPLKVLWNFAATRKLIAARYELPRIPEYYRVPRGWTVTEVSAMLESARQEHGMVGGIPAGVFWRAFILTLWDTGCRKGALLKARPDDFSPTRMLLWIRAENQKRRNEQVFPLSRQTVEALAAMTVHCQSTRARLFPWQRDGFAGSQYRSLNRHFRRILKRAGLPTAGKYFHRFRASRASYGELTAAGSAQSVLGHADIATTRRYLDPLIIAESRLVDLLPRPR